MGWGGRGLRAMMATGFCITTAEIHVRRDFGGSVGVAAMGI